MKKIFLQIHKLFVRESTFASALFECCYTRDLGSILIK